MTSSGRRTFFANNFWYKRARDVGLVPHCSSRQGASTDMQHDLLRSHCDLDLAWPEVNFFIDLTRIKKHMDRCGLTRGTRWCQNYSPSFYIWEVIHEQTILPKRTFFRLVTSCTYRIRMTTNLRAQIDSGDPGLLFGYFTILLASILIETIAMFCENNPILIKFDLSWLPVTSNLTWSKNDRVFFVELATAYPTPFSACRYLS